MTDADVRRAARDELLVTAVRRASPSALEKLLPVSYATGFAPAANG
jgi:hypothetical protein